MTRQIHALIVDDSATSRKMIINALEQTGLAEFVFTEAQDGVDALDKFRPGQTQLLLVDMNMPRLSGLELVRELHKRHRLCPPAVMITGETNIGRLQEALHEAGVDALLLKPVDRDRLWAGLKTLVDSIPTSAGPCVVPHGECVPLALQEVLAKTCDLVITPTPADEGLRHGEIVLSLVSIHGGVHWSVGLGFAGEAAHNVAARFAGSAMPTASVDIGDAIGELTNIVAGRIKRLLSARDIAVTPSAPSVLRAAGLEILTQRRRKATIAYTHFDSPVGKMWSAVTVSIASDIFL